MSEIGCKLSMPKPHITSLVDKLIVEEMVERLFDPKDRRVVFVQITPKGVKDFNDIKSEISMELRGKLELLEASKLKDFSVAAQLVKDNLMTIIVENNSNQASCRPL